MSDRDLNIVERRALEWLLDGNGQKFISPKLPHGEWATEKRALLDSHRELERRGLVRVGLPDFHGWRSCNITDEGRAALVAPVRCRNGCGRAVEEARVCYATPVCYACLPPPAPLPIATAVAGAMAGMAADISPAALLASDDRGPK